MNDNSVVFTDENLLQAYAARHAADKLGLVWEDVEAFATSFNNIERHGFKFGARREFGAAVLILLAMDDQRDVVGRMAEFAHMALVDDGERGAFWDLYPPFCKAFPMLIIDADHFALASDVIIKASAKDMIWWEAGYTAR
ncbi:hypothetical protein HC891_01895 [Candidatus Gracilibacteria bacterium]|nr:hypothetical protein [Candidatus Gracilibacteria bacterium]